MVSLGTPDCSPNKTDSHDIVERVLKVALNTIPVIILTHFPSYQIQVVLSHHYLSIFSKIFLSFFSFSLDNKQLINLQLQGMVQKCKSGKIKNMKH